MAALYACTRDRPYDATVCCSQGKNNEAGFHPSINRYTGLMLLIQVGWRCTQWYRCGKRAKIIVSVYAEFKAKHRVILGLMVAQVYVCLILLAVPHHIFSLCTKGDFVAWVSSEHAANLTAKLWMKDSFLWVGLVHSPWLPFVQSE